ncbi:hypothetical protein D8674_015427 [Pyrus ussuriensis x Pyrus communis]|uniref:Uncharacterized protein n=1 Tax=Pyrus ussuriensis x Pyrus communis TaxID=2448454 RepID=A0A5N5GW99_9ROSA|nr:hypothetical protein D8674_015427 [Pyrus ussuriensis x Pyrus communis]
MEPASPKSPPPESAISVQIGGKLPELIDELLPEIPIKEELIQKVMQELYKEITAGTTTTTATSDCTKPSSPVATFPTPSLVVGNGKSESCGASVSDSASTVMAGVEFVGPAGKTWGSPENGAWMNECGWNDTGLGVGKEGMDGRDHAREVDDEWLERVLMSTWGPVDLDPWL